MYTRNDSSLTLARVAAFIILLTVVALLAAGCEDALSARLHRAQRLIPPGTPREEAVAILGRDSWYHQECRYSAGSVTDLFFYGSRRWDEATILIVGSTFRDGQFRVTGIGTFADAAPWQATFANCVQRDRFED